MLPQLFWIPTDTGGRLATMAHPPGGAQLPAVLQAIRGAGVDRLLILLADEELRRLDLWDEPHHAAAAGLSCARFPIADFTTPPLDEHTTQVITSLAEAVQAGQSVLIHCWGGVGRSSLIAAAVLVLLGHEPEAALDRISAARGRRVPDTAAQRMWVINFSATHTARSARSTPRDHS